MPYRIGTLRVSVNIVFKIRLLCVQCLFPPSSVLSRLHCIARVKELEDVQAIWWNTTVPGANSSCSS
ncbi:hypothetical protein K1719_001624 [Acacia pycnantha]|nr:hypothetical protein K1719_001624 [Acacia pycnantha]